MNTKSQSIEQGALFPSMKTPRATHFNISTPNSRGPPLARKDAITFACLVGLGLGLLCIGAWNWCLEVRLGRLEDQLQKRNFAHDNLNKRHVTGNAAAPTGNENNRPVPSAHVVACSAAPYAARRVGSFFKSSSTFLHNFFGHPCRNHTHLHGNMTLVEGGFLTIPVTGLYHIYGQVGLRQDRYPVFAGGIFLSEVCFDSEQQTTTRYKLEKFVIHPSSTGKFNSPFVAGTFAMRQGCRIGIEVDFRKSWYLISTAYQQSFMGAFMVDNL